MTYCTAASSAAGGSPMGAAPVGSTEFARIVKPSEIRSRQFPYSVIRSAGQVASEIFSNSIIRCENGAPFPARSGSGLISRQIAI